MSTVTWAIQNALVAKANKLFGDDPHVSALLSAIVVSFVGYASLYSFKISMWIMKSISCHSKETGSVKAQRVFVAMYTEERSSFSNSTRNFNELFLAMEWFITNLCDACENVSAFVSPTAFRNRLRMVPSVNVRHTFSWQGRKLTYCMLDRALNPAENSKREVGCELTGQVSPEELQDFTTFCWKAYIEHVNTRIWEQKLWTCSGRDWAPQNTHNLKLWKNVVLPPDIKKAFIDDLSTFMSSEGWYAEQGASWTRGYLLYGLAGTGKSSMIKAMSNAYQMDIYSCNLRTIANDDCLTALFRSIPKRSVVVMEDVDAMGSVVHTRKVEEQEDKESTGVTLSGLLNVLDGLANAHGRVLMMTTNHKDKLDPALIRPGRIDMQIHLKYCTNEQVREFFEVICGCRVDRVKIPDYVLSPAEVSSILMTHRTDHKQALAQVESLARSKGKKP